MDINEFVLKFSEQFDYTDSSVFSVDTSFRELDEWSSLTAFNVLAMIEDDYHVTLKAENLRQCKTIEDVYKLVEIAI